jgi:hypothetical protein
VRLSGEVASSLVLFPLARLGRILGTGGRRVGRVLVGDTRRRLGARWLTLVFKRHSRRSRWWCRVWRGTGLALIGHARGSHRLDRHWLDSVGRARLKLALLASHVVARDSQHARNLVRPHDGADIVVCAAAARFLDSLPLHVRRRALERARALPGRPWA